MINNKNNLRIFGGITLLVAAATIFTCEKIDDNCGRGAPYNPDYQFCFGGAAHDLCGGYKYNPQSEGCYKNTVATKCPDGGFTLLNASCAGYTVDISLAPNNDAGTVTRVPDKPRYAAGENVTIHATANAGYTFAGWGGAVVSDESSVMLTMLDNKPIVAMFNPTTGTAPTYMLAASASPKEGGTVFVNNDAATDEPTIHSRNTTVAVRAEAAEGYEFSGWSGSVTSAEQIVTVTMDGNKVLTANFTTTTTNPTATRFIVAFEVDGANVKTITVDSGKTIGAAGFPTVAAREGFGFDGWVDDAGTVYAAGTIITKDVTLTAKWTAVVTPPGEVRSFTVEFDANGGSPSIINSVSVDSGKTLATGTPSLPADPTRSGFSFGGWFDDTMRYTSSTVITKDITLIAGWIKHITVAFDTDGGSPAAINPITVDSGSAFGVAVLPAEPTKTGWSFGGWFNGAEQYTQNTVITQSVTLTAGWMYKVSFNANGGSPSILSDALVPRNGTLGTAIPAITKEGHILVGWFDGTTQYTPNTSITKNVTLTAIFRQDGVQIGSVTDPRNGKTYKTVKIGDYWWMAENLDFATDSSWCYGDADSNCVKYGRLYAWNAAKSACLGMGGGWHLPDRDEWDNLLYAVGGKLSTNRTFSEADTRLKSTSGWPSNNNGTDDYGFSALPGGLRRFYDIFDYDVVSYIGVGERSYWWSAAEYDGKNAYIRHMYYNNSGLDEMGLAVPHGSSVRCVHDD